jgi:hypothetical protein
MPICQNHDVWACEREPILVVALWSFLARPRNVSLANSKIGLNSGAF